MNYRHGDLALVGIKTLPGELKETKTDVILKGTSNTHTFKGGKLYLKAVDEYVFGYLVAKNTTLYHTDHGKGDGLRTAKIRDGVYELRKQVEHTHDGLRPVKD